MEHRGKPKLENDWLDEKKSQLSNFEKNNSSSLPIGNGSHFHTIPIPDAEDDSFSFRKLWAFTGPGFLMCIAYIDPGNIEAYLQAGTAANYKLLWVLLLATVMGLVMQRLSVRLGVVTGLHLAEMAYRQYKRVPRLLLWIMIEIAIIGADMQEVIGTSIALYLLSFKYIPLWAGVLITMVDTFTFLFLDKYGLRKLELFFGFLITVMAFTFGYQYIVSAPPQTDILGGLFVPWNKTYNSDAVLKAVAVVGAVIMPHNFYLHSALGKSRAVDRTKHSKVREANMYHFTEAAMALLVSVIISIFVVSIFAQGLYGKTNAEVNSVCASNNFTIGIENLESDDEAFEADLYKAGIFLGCQFGIASMLIWAVGILASGQSATMAGTYAGQFAMEGFLNLQWARWKRVLFTRTIAIIPTFIVSFYANINDMTTLNDYLNAVMSLQAPFAILPTIAFTSNAHIMGPFKNGLGYKIVTSLLSVVIITINIYFVISKVQEDVPFYWYNFTIIGIYATFYLIFCLYLAVHMAVQMGATGIGNSKFYIKYFDGQVNSNSFLTKSPSGAN